MIPEVLLKSCPFGLSEACNAPPYSCRNLFRFLLWFVEKNIIGLNFLIATNTL